MGEKSHLFGHLSLLVARALHREQLRGISPGRWRTGQEGIGARAGRVDSGSKGVSRPGRRPPGLLPPKLVNMKGIP
jgi:hypothetical protein